MPQYEYGIYRVKRERELTADEKREFQGMMGIISGRIIERFDATNDRNAINLAHDILARNPLEQDEAGMLWKGNATFEEPAFIAMFKNSPSGLKMKKATGKHDAQILNPS